MCSLDQQHENGVNLLEFVAATLNADDISDDEILRTAFRIFDRQHTGGITHQNLKGIELLLRSSRTESLADMLWNCFL